MPRIWIVALVIASSACLAPDPAPHTTVAAVAALGADGGDGETPCPSWGCGENSPIIGPYGFHELNTLGTENLEHVSITDFQKDGVSYRTRIVGGSRLIATAADGTVLSGADLTGGYFAIATPTGPYRIVIARVSPLATSTVKFWIGPDSSIETYQLVYLGPGATTPLPLCNRPPTDTFTDGPGWVWHQPLEAILYSGDRYDSARKRVTASSVRGFDGWFNIACAGSALAKLHLTRHTTAGSTLGYTTTVTQRQAMLKMYVSDLCGTGTAWTKKGTPLHWTNTLHWSVLDGHEFAHEALWTADGAACLDVHRLGTLYASTVSGFLAECAPPPCPAVPLGAPLPLGAYVLSAVPVAPAT
jgi:hypothetical protein